MIVKAACDIEKNTMVKVCPFDCECVSWIHIKDRLPEFPKGEYVNVIISTYDGLVLEAIYSKDGFFAGSEVYDVTHWMPLPKPPEGR